MGNGSSIHGQSGGKEWWISYCRAEWRSQRSRQLDEVLGLQRPPVRRGQSLAHLEEVVRKLTQDPLPLLPDCGGEDNNDLKAAIAKLSSGSLLHTEKRAIERLLAQRYEDALALANAAAEQGGSEGSSGASEVLRQVLVVFRQNNLPTELDRSGGGEEAAEWRLRLHAARRRAFLVVRSLVRLKREVKRLSAPIPDLGWLLPVAAGERWGELKALAARYRQLEGALQDTELAISQLVQLREVHGKVLAARSTVDGRASPQRVMRSGPGRMRQGIVGRAVSESGAVTARLKPRTTLTADPPPPPVSSGRGRHITSSIDPGNGTGNGNGTANCSGSISPPGFLRLPSPGPGAAGARTPPNGKKGGAGGSDGVSSVVVAAPATALIPTISAQRSGSGGGGTAVGGGGGAALSGLYNTRLSVSGGSINTGGNLVSGLLGGTGGGILSGASTLTSPSGGRTPPARGRLSAPGTGPASGAVPCAAPLSPGQQEPPATPRTAAAVQVGEGGAGVPSPPPGPTPAVRQTFLTGDGSPPPAALGPRSSLPRVAQFLDLTTYNPNAPHHYWPPCEPDVRSPNAPHSAPVSMLVPEATSLTSPSALRNSTTATAMTAAATTLRGGAAVATAPSPPSGPPPSSGARRPLGALSHSSPMTIAAAGPAARSAAAGGTVGGTVGGRDPPPVLVQDGESAGQALARFKLLAEDVRDSLVDTARQFRAVLDLCNSTWPDQRWWLAAHTQEDAALDTWPASDEFVVHRADVVRCLKAGAVAFQFMCAPTGAPPEGQGVVGPTGNRFDLWTSDPWELAAELAPERLAEAQAAVQRSGPGDRLVGLPFGVRVLQQLANSVAEAAGPAALDRLPIILHVNERQREVIAADMLQYGIYKRLRRNLFLVVQRSQPVMRYSAPHHAYLPAPDQPEYLPGSGYSMLQLLWPGHAWFMGDSGELQRLPHSLMHELRGRSLEWFVCKTSSDLSLLLGDGALDMRSLAHVSYMWNTPHLRYSVVVEAASTYAKHRDMIAQYGTVLLCRKPKVAGMVVGRLDGAVRLDRYGGPGSGPGGRHQLPVVELTVPELNSAHMQEELGQVAAARATATSVGIGRYVFRFEVLSNLLTGPTVLRPKLLPLVDVRALRPPPPPVLLRRRSSVSSALLEDNAAGWAAHIGAAAGGKGPGGGGGGAVMFPFPTPGGASEHQLAFAAGAGADTLLLRLHLSITDLTMHHASKVVALKAHRPPVLLRGAQDGPQLVEVLMSSDHDLGGAAERLAAKLPSFARQQKPAQHILVFVQDNSVSLTATNVAAGLVRRERGDRIHLVTVVPSEAQRVEGAGLLERLAKAFRTHVDVVAHVLSQDGRGLLECLADVVAQQRCGLLVVGSSSITAVSAVAPRNVPLVLPGMAGPKPPGGGMGGGGGAGTPAGRGGAVGASGGGVLDEGASELLLSSVALSILRTLALPVILVTANTRTYLKRHVTDGVPNGGRPARPLVGGVGGAPSGRLSALVVVERHSRPLMHHLTRCLMEPALRQDALTLTQVLPPGLAPGNAGYDPSSIQCVALKTLMANFEAIAAANDFHTPGKVFTQGEWHAALCIAARDTGAQLLCVQLAPGATRSLPPALLQLIRSAPCPVLVYPEKSVALGTWSEAGRDSGVDGV